MSNNFRFVKDPDSPTTDRVELLELNLETPKAPPAEEIEFEGSDDYLDTDTLPFKERILFSLEEVHKHMRGSFFAGFVFGWALTNVFKWLIL